MKPPRKRDTPNWGTVPHLLATKVEADKSWWISAPRESFTQHAEAEIPRMRRGRGAIAIEGLSRPWE